MSESSNAQQDEALRKRLSVAYRCYLSDGLVETATARMAEIERLRATIARLKDAIRILGEMTVDARGKALAAEVELNLGGGR